MTSARRSVCCVVVLVGLSLPEPVAADKVVALERIGKTTRECALLDSLRSPVKGGCVLKAKFRRKAIRYDVVTPFGSMRFASCGSSFTARIAARGSLGGPVDVLVDSFTGDNTADLCGDVRVCLVDGTDMQRPWSGVVRLDEDGGAYMDLHVCLDTCMGWFEGKTRFELDRVAGEWRIRADRTMVGDSGIEMDGEWRTGNRDLRLAAGTDG